MSAMYHIKVEGHLDHSWANDWFDGLNIVDETNGQTLLYGNIIDQPALFGILKKIRDLGLTLLLVKRIENESV